jgi:hypothetical protein
VKKVITLTFLTSILVITSLVSGQTATIWGPGENYEIDYLHSGLTRINGTEVTSFQNQPSTEFTVQNITNDGYDYLFIGYGGIQETQKVTIQSFSFQGIGNFQFPVGGFPVVLPLAYGEHDDWLEYFATQIDTIGGILSQFGSLASFGQTNATIEDNNIIIEFQTNFNQTIDTTSIFASIPTANDPFEEASFSNGTIYSKIDYKRSTGVLNSLDLQISAENYTSAEGIYGDTLFFQQQLDFVAIIPPSSILEEVPFSLEIVVVSIIAVPLLQKIRKI